MGVAIRVIPCLDVDAGRVVKGINFEGLRDAGDPVELAHRYDRAGADELTFLDVTASSGNRETTFDVVARTAGEVFIPLTVGGGRARRGGGGQATALRRGQGLHQHRRRDPAGGDRRDHPALRIPGAGALRGRPAHPPRRTCHPSGFEVTTMGGRQGTGIDAVAWAREAADRGVGEILLNSIDADGTLEGFDLELIRAVRAAVKVPIIASGGAGKPEHFPPAVAAGADAVLAASVFHFGPDNAIAQVKAAIREAGYEVR